MSRQTLVELITEYHKTSSQIKELEEIKKSLKAQIDLRFSEMGENEFKGTHYSAVISESQRVKYDLEGIAAYLRLKGLPESSFASTKADTKKIEALISSGDLNPDEIMNYCKVTGFKTLRVTENDG